MRYILLTLLISSIYSCSQNKKLSFENDGGMIIDIIFDKTNIDFKENIIERVKFFNKLNNIEKKYDFSSLIVKSKIENKLTIKLPYLLTKKDLEKLILSKGEMAISKKNKHLEKDKIERIETSFNILLRRNIDVFFKNKEILLNYLNNSLNQEITITLDKKPVSSLIVNQIPDNIEKLSFSISLDYNPEIVYTLIKLPYEGNLKIDLTKKNFYLKSKEGIIKMKPEIFSLYKKFRLLATEDYGLIYNVLNQIKPNNKHLSKIILKKNLDFIVNHDFENFLILSRFENIDSFKKFFTQFKFIEYYKNRFDNNAQEEILKITEIINRIENY